MCYRLLFKKGVKRCIKILFIINWNLNFFQWSVCEIHDFFFKIILQNMHFFSVNNCCHSFFFFFHDYLPKFTIFSNSLAKLSMWSCDLFTKFEIFSSVVYGNSLFFFYNHVSTFRIFFNNKFGKFMIFTNKFLYVFPWPYTTFVFLFVIMKINDFFLNDLSKFIILFSELNDKIYYFLSWLVVKISNIFFRDKLGKFTILTFAKQCELYADNRYVNYQSLTLFRNIVFKWYNSTKLMANNSIYF